MICYLNCRFCPRPSTISGWSSDFESGFCIALENLYKMFIASKKHNVQLRQPPGTYHQPEQLHLSQVRHKSKSSALGREINDRQDFRLRARNRLNCARDFIKASPNNNNINHHHPVNQRKESGFSCVVLITASSSSRVNATKTTPLMKL